MPKIEVLVGMIASGKSTYARHRADRGALVVCHDDLTEMLHARYRYEADLKPVYTELMKALAWTAILSNHDVVIDRTHLTREARAAWVNFRASVPVPGVEVVAVTFPTESAIVHAERRFTADARGRSFLEWGNVAVHHRRQWLAEPLDHVKEGFDARIDVLDRQIAAWAAEPCPFPAHLPPRSAADGKE